MSNSTPATSSQLFTKRRRAFVACITCRQRKIKCTTVSDADYQPCTRCVEKGIKCEYQSVTDDDDYSSTPSPDVQGPSRASGWHAQPPITPPSAGLVGYLNPGSAPSRGSSRTTGPRPGATSPYPPAGAYPYRPHGMRTPGSGTNAQFPPPPTNSLPYASGHTRGPSMQDPGRSASQFYNASPNQQPAPNYQQPHGANAPYGQAYLPQSQPGGPAYQWPQGVSATLIRIAANACAHLDRVIVAPISMATIADEPLAFVVLFLRLYSLPKTFKLIVSRSFYDLQ
ncbi:hypothetical protein DFH09DRAFT_1101510 [Mycena vulgaris]|nr:hypothetical protein DFH09DRAFT_1101510 [Mycena vulgaris]